VKKQPSETADDKLLGKVIAAELRRQLAGAESDCPETETVAGFYDRTLSDNERAYWEKHFLTCMRCQEYLAELARLADADEPPPMLGEDAEPATVESSPGWFYRLAWVIPFLVIGIGSAIWYYEDIQRVFHHDETAMNTAVPEATPGQPAIETRTLEKTARAERNEAKPSAPVPATAAKIKADQAPPPTSAELARPETSAGGGMAAPPARAEARNSSRAEEASSKQEVAAPAATANVPAERGAGLGEGKVSGFGALSVRGAQQKVTTQWRVGRRGTIQKADGQGGWTRIVSGVDDDLFDITFAGSTGWAVGHGGIVLRSADGGDSWQRVTAPTSEDLVHVSSLGSQQASVFSRSGKTYSTNDGGQTWK
jgi:hypothetical protein